MAILHMEVPNSMSLSFLKIMLFFCMTGMCVSMCLFSWVRTDINLHSPVLCGIVGSSKIVVEDRQWCQQHAHTMMNSPDHATDKSNHLPVANKADKKQMMSVSPLYWVIRLIECNWAMHRSAERRHQASGETGGGRGGRKGVSGTRKCNTAPGPWD